MKLVPFETKIDESLSLIIPDLSRAEEIFDLIDKDRNHLRTWLPWVDATCSVEDTRENLAERIKTFGTSEQAAFFGTFNGDIVASVGFVSLKDNEGEIGYWLLSNYGGRGLMTTFVKACIDFGFDELSLDRIVIKCAEANIKSARIPKRLSFTQMEKSKTTRTRNGSEHHTLIFTLDRNDWYT